jgi:hypothetical protein
MNTVTIPPAEPAVETGYTNPVLVRHPKFSECSAGQVLTNLWADGLGKDDLLVVDGNLRFHLSVVEEGVARYHFRSEEGRQAYLTVFKDFSALIHEDLGDDLRYICANPLRLGRTHRCQESGEDSVKILARTSMGSLHHEVHLGANSTLSRNLGLCAYSGGCKEGQRVDQLHSQMLAEARWWLASSPRPSPEAPPIGARFNLATEQERAFLREVAKIGVWAAFTHCPNLKPEMEIEVHIDCPKPLLPTGKPGPFKVQATLCDPTSIPGSAASNSSLSVDRTLTDFVERAINSHPEIDPIDFLCQRPDKRSRRESPFVYMYNVEHPSAHEAMEAYRKILDWG